MFGLRGLWEVAEHSLNEMGLAFMFAPHFHPAMKRVAHIRRELNRRTIFNLLGPLTNPASAPYQIVGVYSSDLTEKLGRALLALGCQRAWVIHSHDGLDELSTGAPARVCEARDKKVKNLIWIRKISALRSVPWTTSRVAQPKRMRTSFAEFWKVEFKSGP